MKNGGVMRWDSLTSRGDQGPVRSTQQGYRCCPATFDLGHARRQQWILTTPRAVNDLHGPEICLETVFNEPSDAHIGTNLLYQIPQIFESFPCYH